MITRTALILTALTSASLAATSSLAITNIVQEVVGSTSTVTGSGSTANTTTWTLSSSARFLMSGTNAAGESITVGLEIQPTANSGGLQPNTDSLMIARTANSQSLTDTGTVSIYVAPAAAGAWSLDLAFRFYDPGFTTPVATPIWLTSLDLDFNQQMTLLESDIQSYTLETGSDIGVTDQDGAYRFTGVGDSVYSDPDHAVSVETLADSEFNIRLQHTGVALFMFELRNPSDNVTYANPVTVTVPEPTGAMLIGSAGLLLLMRRRRI